MKKHKFWIIVTAVLAPMYVPLLLYIWWAHLDEIVFGVPDVLVTPVITTDVEGMPKNVFRVGEKVFVRIHFERKRICDVTLIRHIEDGFVYTLRVRGRIGGGNLGVKGPFVNKILIAERPGNFAYHIKLIFRCNPVGRIVVNRAPALFTVVRDK